MTINAISLHKNIPKKEFLVLYPLNAAAKKAGKRD
jgi:hypothetical protein